MIRPYKLYNPINKVDVGSILLTWIYWNIRSDMFYKKYILMIQDIEHQGWLHAWHHIDTKCSYFLRSPPLLQTKRVSFISYIFKICNSSLRCWLYYTWIRLDRRGIDHKKTFDLQWQKAASRITIFTFCNIASHSFRGLLPLQIKRGSLILFLFITVNSTWSRRLQ